MREPEGRLTNYLDRFARSPFAHIFFAGLLFLAGFVRLLALAESKTYGADEQTALAEIRDYTYYYLFTNGPTAELNTSPLHYLLDKSWLKLWGNEPQFRWELLQFFRILPITYWCLVTVLIFLATRFLLARFTKPFTAIAVALSLAALAFSKSLLTYFAAEDRPYSLWVLWGICQLCLFTLCYVPEFVHFARVRYAYGVSCLLLVFTAYVSILQVALAGLIYLLLPPAGVTRGEKRFHFQVVVAAGLVALWYLHTALQGPEQQSQVAGALEALEAQLTAGLRPWVEGTLDFRTFGSPWAWVHWTEKAWYAACFFLPLFFFRQPGFRAVTLLAFGLVASSLLIAFALRWKGQIINGPKYLMFLFPYLFALFLMSLYALERGLSWALARLGATGRFVSSALPLVVATYWIYSALSIHIVEFANTRPLGDKERQLSLLFLAEPPKATCPPQMAYVREGIKKGIELNRVRELCR